MSDVARHNAAPAIKSMDQPARTGAPLTHEMATTARAGLKASEACARSENRSSGSRRPLGHAPGTGESSPSKCSSPCRDSYFIGRKHHAVKAFLFHGDMRPHCLWQSPKDGDKVPDKVHYHALARRATSRSSPRSPKGVPLIPGIGQGRPLCAQIRLQHCPWPNHFPRLAHNLLMTLPCRSLHSELS